MSKRKNIRHRSKGRAAAVIAAVCVAAGSGTAVFAAERSGLFDRIRGNSERTYTDSRGNEHKMDKVEDLNNYDIVDDYFVDDVEQSSEDESSALSVNIESTYCDGRNLIIAMTGSLADGNPTGAELIQFSVKLDIDGTVYDQTDVFDEKYMWLYGNLMLDEGTENSFTGQITMQLHDGFEIAESANAKLTLLNAAACSSEPAQNGMRTPLGDVVKNIRIVVDQSLRNGTAVREEEDGFFIKLYDYSPANIRVEWGYPELYDSMETIDENGMIPKYSLILLFYDEDGNDITFLNNGIGTEHKGNLTTPTNDTVTGRIYNKQIQDENGHMQLLKEFTLDISSMRTSE